LARGRAQSLPDRSQRRARRRDHLTTRRQPALVGQETLASERSPPLRFRAITPSSARLKRTRVAVEGSGIRTTSIDPPKPPSLLRDQKELGLLLQLPISQTVIGMRGSIEKSMKGTSPTP